MAYFFHRETPMKHDLQVTENSVIRTLPLEMKRERDAIIAGSFQKNTRCISISEPGARALDLMNNGLTLAEIKKELRDTYHVAISLHGLIRGLHDANLIQSIDDRKMQRHSSPPLASLSQPLARSLPLSFPFPPPPSSSLPPS